MNNIYKISRLIFLFLAELVPSNGLKAQVTDSLSLKPVIEEIVASHPTIKSAQEALRNAEARIMFAKTGYYPQVDMTANAANIGPVIQLTIPEYGTVKLYPNNSYSAAINYRQVIYDFGRTRQNVEIETENKAIGEQTLEQVKQRIALAAVNSFYSVAYLQEAIRIKDEQLSTLNDHLKYIETMKATGSATDYQILSTKVRISAAESQKADLLTSLVIQQAYMSSLLGKEDLKPVVKKELQVSSPEESTDSLVSYAFHNRDEILIDEKKAALAELRYELVRSMNRPVINFLASGGFKNGYIPDLEKLKGNYTVGVGISVPLFDGLKTKYNLMQSRSAINMINLDAENTRRNISSEVKEAEAYVTSALQKVSQFSLQYEQAVKAYSLAETSFRTGTITNLDLLDANTNVSESRLMLLKARIDYTASIYRLKAALGERLY